MITSFDQLSLQPELLETLTKLKFSAPTPIQAKVIPHLLEEARQDLVALAQTGSGKTLAFGLPLAQKLNPTKDKVQALILTPTRELAAQVSENLNQIFPCIGLRTLAIYGGTSYSHQKAKLKRTPQVIIATPGRLVDLIHQKQIDLTELKVLVLDEADRMLSMGFEEDLQFILDATHENKKDDDSSGRASCQTWLFSATMGPGIKRILHRYLNEPVMVNQVEANQGVSATLQHYYLAVRGGQRQQGLIRILSTIDDFYGIIFCQTKKEVQDVEDALRARRIDCMSIHGDKVQKDREQIIRKLKEGKFSVLVATDVAARGIDIKNLTHVVHYSLPYELESYIHRSGRTGRAGETGTVISILESSDFSKLNRLVRTTKVDMKPFKVKTGEEVLSYFIQKEIVQTQSAMQGHPLAHKVLLAVEKYLEDSDSTKSPGEWITSFLLYKISRTDAFSDSFLMSDFSISSPQRTRESSGRYGDRGGGRPRGGGFSRHRSDSREGGRSWEPRGEGRGGPQKRSTETSGVTRFKDRPRKAWDSAPRDEGGFRDGGRRPQKSSQSAAQRTREDSRR